MTTEQPDNNAEKPYDDVIHLIVDYAYNFNTPSDAALTRAKAALLDSLGAALESLNTSKECAALVGPLWPNQAGAVSGAFRLPGTKHSLDLLKGAFDLGATIRYLDHNDAFAGAEWGHPSATADVLSRDAATRGDTAAGGVTIYRVLLAMIKAYEIQGCFQEHNAFNRVGLDHTILVKIGSTAAVSWLMGLTVDQALSAVSHAWADGHPLRVYRQAPNTGPRKGWAAGDACTCFVERTHFNGLRAVHLASLARTGQPGIRRVLTDPRWGFYHTLNKDNEFKLPRPFGNWVMENVLFKVTTAEGHGLTAVEAALDLVKQLQERNLDVKDIKSIRSRTQKPAMIIINKEGPLHNPADRDHCLRYMVAVVLLKGSQIDTEDYQNDSPWSTDERLEQLRTVITMEEEEQFTLDYHNSAIRSAANSLEITMNDGTKLFAQVDFPLGHVQREESLPLVSSKAVRNLRLGLPADRVDEIVATVNGPDFEKLEVSKFVDLFQP
ncbi:putative 2-methylcitrate dehydratase [Seiridium unicorne]|uniref:2-methylcitrate dehydratase n=1 Tax=Seiridium unicorne TaxID=138068 RepID=A0ABR2V4G5_9PEZI